MSRRKEPAIPAELLDQLLAGALRLRTAAKLMACQCLSHRAQARCS